MGNVRRPGGKRKPRTSGTPIRPERAPLILVQTPGIVLVKYGNGYRRFAVRIPGQKSKTDSSHEGLRIQEKPVVGMWGGTRMAAKLDSEVGMKVSQLIGSRTEIFSIAEEISVMEVARYLREKQGTSVR